MNARERVKNMFYGYRILLGTLLLHAIGSGAYFYGFSVFYTPLKEEFGWSSAVTSGAVSLSRLEGGIEGPIVGYLIDKYGARKLLALGVFMTGLGFIAMTLIDSVWMLYLIYGGILSIGYNTGFTHSLTTMLTHWFYKKRSRAMSIYALGAGFGGALIVPLMARSITLYGWRNTATFCGLSFWIIGLPLVLIFRDKPEDMGLLPDGMDPSLAEELTSGNPGKEPEPEGETLDAMKSPTFKKLLLAECLRAFLLGSIVLHQIPHLMSIGISSEKAATILGLMIFVSIPGRLVFGVLGDFVSKRLLLSAAMLIQAIGVLVFAYATSILHVYVFVVIYGLAYGGAIPLLMAFRGELFGRKRYATMSGVVAPFKMIGSILGPVFAGYMFDLTGSYRFAFQVFAVLAVMSSAVFFSVREGLVKPSILAKSR